MNPPAAGSRSVFRSSSSGFALLIVILAAGLRFANLGDCEFKQDEARNAYAVQEVLRTGDPAAATVPTSIGGVTPPTFILLMALPLAGMPHPVAGAVVVALLNVVTVLLCWWCCQGYFNRRVAVVATLLYAVNPWAILYSRKFWHCDPLPLLALLFFFALIDCHRFRRPAAALLALLLAELAPQFHATGWALFPVWVIAMLMIRPRFSGKLRWWGGLVALTVVSLPVLLDPRGTIINLQAVRQYLSLPTHFYPAILLIPFKLATAVGFGVHPPGPISGLFQLAIALGAALIVAVRAKMMEYRLLLLWLAAPVALLLASRIEPPLHYFLILYPVPFIIIGVAADELWREAGAAPGRWRQTGIVAVIALLVLLQGSAAVRFFGFDLREARNIRAMDYGPPLEHRLAEIRDLLREGVTDPSEVQARLLAGKTPDQAFKYDDLATRYLLDYLRRSELPPAAP